MAHILLGSCRNWCSFARFSRGTPIASLASLSGRSRLETAGCLPMLQRKWISSVQRNHLASRSTVKRWHTFMHIVDFSGRVRLFSFSKIVCTHDERDERSGVKVDSDSASESSDRSSDYRVSSDSEEDNVKAQPVSDADIDKELRRYDYEEFELIPDEEVSVVQPVKESIPVERKRGITGVFDVEEVVDLLRNEKAQDICVILVPPECKYVDHMVIVTGRSTRHIQAMAAYIRWMYKCKRSSSDPPSVKIEGEMTKDWYAIDLEAVRKLSENELLLIEFTPDTDWSLGDPVFVEFGA